MAKAASVGANTVNGPLPFRVSTRPAAFTAATSVLKDPAEAAVSTISRSMARAPAAAMTQTATIPAIRAKFFIMDISYLP